VTLTLAGPQRLNALSAGLNVQLQDRLDEIAGNPTIRSVVITGENRLRGRRPADDAGRQPSSSRLEQRGRRQLIHGVGSAASSAASSGRLHRPTSCLSQRERMTFIFRLFRSRQKSLELFDPPFQYEQRLAIAGNQLPAGAL
jgi:hypothetical protein